MLIFYFRLNSVTVFIENFPPSVSPQRVIEMCESMSDEMLATISPQLLGDFPNTYCFTKAITETLIVEECADLPVAIIRPSIVAASWVEPSPGWVDGLNGFTSFMAAMGKGFLRYCYGINKCRTDIIPVDTFINLMITLVWSTSTHPTDNIQVYNCTSGSLKPICGRKYVFLLNTQQRVKSLPEL